MAGVRDDEQLDLAAQVPQAAGQALGLGQGAEASRSPWIRRTGARIVSACFIAEARPSIVDSSASSRLFTWRDPDDPRAAFDILRNHPRVDRERIGLVGFSQGGVYSLLIAAYTGQAAAVVAYYPVTDFETWLSGPQGGRPGEGFVWRRVSR